MDGQRAVRATMIGDAALTALVPATRIVGGVLRKNEALPGIALQSISKVDRNIPNPGAYRHVQERIQATVVAKEYDNLHTVLAALRKACDAKYPAVSGLIRVTVHLGPGGPEFMSEDASLYLGTQDLLTTYSVAR